MQSAEIIQHNFQSLGRDLVAGNLLPICSLYYHQGLNGADLAVILAPICVNSSSHLCVIWLDVQNRH